MARALLGVDAPPVPSGVAEEWLDAAGPESLLALRMVTRVAAAAPVEGGKGRLLLGARPRALLRDLAAFVNMDSAEWPAREWVGPAGQCRTRRLAAELEHAGTTGFTLPQALEQPPGGGIRL